ncbi:uncharacterized protein LOC120110738 [Phoenix dactylifera]|uniref:Uncharacterized protein LOC120110738 n=1 Tax=Phoenix dactylifera TaxID=42345 RepID=A0A8B9A930_PHODC|nr:uncharacterized protein LOC120110738 [Phoenix dactylifera]
MPLSTYTLLLLSSNSHPNISFATKATMPSLLLFILLLSVSISACDGRHPSVHDKDFTRAFHHSSKDAAVAKLDDKTSAPLKPASSEEEIRSSATMERPKGLEAPMKVVEPKRDAVSDAVRIPSLAKVSWRVPRENPGFNLDYMGPRTHPPSHN